MTADIAVTIYGGLFGIKLVVTGFTARNPANFVITYPPGGFLSNLNIIGDELVISDYFGVPVMTINTDQARETTVNSNSCSSAQDLLSQILNNIL